MAQKDPKKEYYEKFVDKNFIEKYDGIRQDKSGRWYVYEHGVYIEKTEEYMRNLMLSFFEEKELHQYRTKKHAGDKLACVSSLISKKEFDPDKNKDILNMKNGLLNMTTLEIFPHTPEYVSLSQLPFDFDMSADCPRWRKFIKEVTKGDDDHARILKQFAGYCLTSSTIYHTALILVGSGRNGKSVFSEILSNMLGDNNTSSLSIDQINERFGVIDLMGKKLNIIEEVKEDYYDSEILKKVISGGSVAAEVKYGSKTTFCPTAKHLFCVNTLPRLSDTSDGAFARFIIVPFLQKFGPTGLPTDPYLTSKLRKELSGILLWAINGLHDLNNQGKFSVTEKNQALIDEYKEENSSVRYFISENCIVGDNREEERDTLYLKYQVFTRNNGGMPKGKQGFMKELKAIGYEIVQHKKIRGVRIYSVKGLSLESITDQNI